MKHRIKLLLLNILLCTVPALQAMGRFKTFGNRLAHATRNFNNKNDLLTKGLKLGVTGIGLAAQYQVSKKAYEIHQMRNDYLNHEYEGSRDEVNLPLLGPKQQAYLQERNKQLLPHDRPVYFGLHNDDNEAFALSYKDGYRIFFTHRFFPQMASFEPDERAQSVEIKDDVTYQTFETLEDAENAVKKSAQKYIMQCEAVDPQVLEPKMGVIRHEIGHAVYNHGEKRANYDAGLEKGVVIGDAVLNMHIIKNVCTKSMTKLGLLGRCSLLGLIYPIMFGIGKAYLSSEYVRKQEREADDFAFAHAESLQELENLKNDFEQWHQRDEIEKEKARQIYSESSIRAMEISARYFHSHPPSLERVQAIEKSIEKWKQQEKTP